MQLKYLLMALAVAAGCSPGDNGATNDQDTDVVTIHVTDRKQTIRNFGASDAWACQFIGQWPDEQRNQAADWLFSLEEDATGRPKGIGLSLWRFNIGAGSAAQDNIGDEWRRAEGFLKDDLTYDWTRQAGQQWFLHAARQRGVTQFTGFSNSPPVQLTKNGKAFSGDGTQANLAPANYVPFAAFLADVAAYLEEQDIALRDLSPFNEPQWDWTGNNQEGSPYTNAEMFAITRKLDSVLTARGLDTKIQLAEAGKMNYLYEQADKPTRGNQIEAFFSSSSPHYVGNLAHVDRVITAHSYFTSAPMDAMKQVRQNIANNITKASVPIEFWQSEYCVLGDQEEIPGPGKDTGMTTALYVARLIHHDLTVANAAAWHWWTALSVYDYKDGLVYATKSKAGGQVEDSKLLWALGNYSRFIRPGAVRVGVTSTSVNISDTKGLMVSAYADDDNDKLVTVIVNYGNIDMPLVLVVEGGAAATFKPYLTAAGESLTPLPEVSPGATVTVPKKSVMTLVSDL